MVETAFGRLAERDSEGEPACAHGETLDPAADNLQPAVALLLAVSGAWLRSFMSAGPWGLQAPFQPVMGSAVAMGLMVSIRSHTDSAIEYAGYA